MTIILLNVSSDVEDDIVDYIANTSTTRRQEEPEHPDSSSESTNPEVTPWTSRILPLRSICEKIIQRTHSNV